MNDFKGRTLRGGLAKVGAKSADFLLRMGSLMVLARLLEPTDFGFVGMVTAITGVLGLLETVAQKLIELYRQVISRRDTQAVRPR